MKTFKNLINPFRYISDVKALMIGLGVMLVTILVAIPGKTFFPDVISVKVGAVSFPFSYLLLQTLANWLILSLVMFALAKVASSSNIRAIDILGTQALARAPFLVVALVGLPAPVSRALQSIMSEIQRQGLAAIPQPSDLATVSVVGIFVLLMLVWYITLSVNALRVSANLKGGRLAVVFVASLILAVVLSMLATKGLNSCYGVGLQLNAAFGL